MLFEQCTNLINMYSTAMENNRFVSILLFTALIMGLASCQSSKKNAAPEKATKPNVVLILSDDQSWTDYSFLGHEQIETPRLDKLAAEALTFTRGYTTAPLCRPALASIASGLYPHQHMVLGNDPVLERPKSRKEWLIARSQKDEKTVSGFEKTETIADLLGQAGYMSLQTGKWWEGHFSRGGFDMGMTHGDPAKGGRHGDVGLKIGRKGMDVIYSFIDSAKASETPFYLWYAPFLPHNPHNPPDSLIQKYLPISPSEAEAKYFATCEWFDITCGQLIDYVEEQGLSNNTLFVYVTDNGWIQDPKRPNRYAPRSKREPYEMGIRTPIMFRWLGGIAPKMDTITAVSSIDIATTILDICGIDPTEEMQGVSVLDEGSLKSRGAIFAETYAHDFTSIDESLYYSIVIDLPWKLIVPNPALKKDESPGLYNIFEDPHELVNLAESNRAKVDELSHKIEDWRNKN